MKKLLFTLALLMTTVLSMQASDTKVTQNSKTFDNVSIGVVGGAMTPLDFNSMFPVNAFAGLQIQKDFTPVFGLQLEGIAVFNNNKVLLNDVKTVVKATNVGLNGIVNLSNLLFGYNGTPRTFEVSTATGLGWLHQWDSNHNWLSAKTGISFAFNLGKAKAHSIVITPAIYWNLNSFNKIQFNKKESQLALMASYIYHFKNSNGTHAFKVWDIGDMNDEINGLRAKDKDNQEKINSLENAIIVLTKELENTKKPTTAAVETKTVVNGEWVVMFSKASAELTGDAQELLKTIPANTKVKVIGTASPEGSAKFNQKLSEKRATNVAEFLKANGVNVVSAEGKGVTGDASNRTAITTVAD